VHRRLDRLDRAVADEDLRGVDAERRRQHPGDVVVRRGVRLEHLAHRAGLDELGRHPLDEQVGRVGVREEAGVDVHLQVGDAVAQREEAGRVRAGRGLDLAQRGEDLGLALGDVGGCLSAHSQYIP
jgi:hypothetical protein